MTLKDYFNEARTYRYDFPTVAAGLLTGGASVVFKGLNSLYRRAGQRSLNRFRRVTESGVRYYDIKGVKVSEISWRNFKDILCVFCYHGDDYSDRVVEKIGGEGPYCYKDADVDVTLNEGDVVIDAGAASGEFSAYAAYKKAPCWAFEPTAGRYGQLLVTADLNPGLIFPVKLALSDGPGIARIATEGVGSPTMVFMAGSTKSEDVEMTTLDGFVKANGIEKVDFIKSDIEGAERQLLRGAVGVMREFGPKLSICTYHLPDDREVLAEIIMNANPRYRIVQGPMKLYAQVV
jgi:FkbM family methyltransferase